jgi:ElaB/YqjD/DUF883 family membrane-anchored ribosome-binding protein
MTSITDVGTITGELKNVIAETEGLLRTTAGTVAAHAVEARARAERSLRKANKLLRHPERQIADRLRGATRATDLYVHAKPWRAIGIAAGIAFAFGCLVARRGTFLD